MFKIIIFFTLGLISLLLVNKLILVFTKNLALRYFIFLLITIFFILIIFLFRENALEINKGIYTPPQYDGEKVIPGNIVGE